MHIYIRPANALQISSRKRFLCWSIRTKKNSKKLKKNKEQNHRWGEQERTVSMISIGKKIEERNRKSGKNANKRRSGKNVTTQQVWSVWVLPRYTKKIEFYFVCSVVLRMKKKLYCLNCKAARNKKRECQRGRKKICSNKILKMIAFWNEMHIFARQLMGAIAACAHTDSSKILKDRLSCKRNRTEHVTTRKKHERYTTFTQKKFIIDVGLESWLNQAKKRVRKRIQLKNAAIIFFAFRTEKMFV